MAFEYDKKGFLLGEEEEVNKKKDLESPTHAQPKKDNYALSTTSNSHNNTFNSEKNISYELPTDKAKDVLGGELLDSFNEIKGVMVGMLGFLSKPISAVSNIYKKNREIARDKKQTELAEKLLKESEKQTKLLKEDDLQAKNSNNKAGGFRLPMFSAKGFIKKLGVLGAVVSAIAGMKDYKSALGMDKDSDLSLSQKVTAGVGGFVTSIDNMIEWAAGDRLLGSKDEVYKKLESLRLTVKEDVETILENNPRIKKVLTSVRDIASSATDATIDTVKSLYESFKNGEIDIIESVSERIEGINEAISKTLGIEKIDFSFLSTSLGDIYDSISNGISDSLEDAKEWIKKTKSKIGLKTKTESNYVDAKDERESVENGLESGKKYLESNDEWKVRKEKLSKQLETSKKEEFKYAKEALLNKDFVDYSKYKEEAMTLLIKEQTRVTTENNKDYMKWSTERNRLQNILKVDLEQIGILQKRLSKSTNAEESEMINTSIRAFGSSYSNTQKNLDSHNKHKPKQEAYSTELKFMNTSTNTSLSDGENTLLNTIRKGEGTSDKKAKRRGYKSGYDTTLGYGKFADDKSKTITSMTLKEVYAHQKEMKKNPKNRFTTGKRDKKGKMIKLPSSAVGAYQFTEPTLKRLAGKLNIDESEKLTPKLQDKLALELVKEAESKGGNFQDKIANTWASVATSKSGKSAYGQHTSTSSSTIQEAIKAYKSDKVKSDIRHTSIKSSALKHVTKDTNSIVSNKDILTSRNSSQKETSTIKNTPQNINIQDNRDLLEAIVRNTGKLQQVTTQRKEKPHPRPTPQINLNINSEDSSV